MIYIVSSPKDVSKLEEYCKRRAVPKNDCVIMCNRRLSRKMINGLFYPGSVVINIKRTPYYVVLKEYDYKIVHHNGEVLVNSELIEEMYMLVSLIKQKNIEVYEFFSIGDIDNDIAYSLGSIIGKMEKDMSTVCSDIHHLRTSYRW